MEKIVNAVMNAKETVARRDLVSVVNLAKVSTQCLYSVSALILCPRGEL